MKQTDDFPGAAAPADGSDASAPLTSSPAAPASSAPTWFTLVDAGNEVVVLDDFSTGHRQNLER